MKMKIDEIEIDEDIYPRKQLSQKRIESYQESLRAGAKFPSILIQKIIDEDGEKVIVLDGVHRITAYKNEKYKEIEVDYWKDKILDKREPEILEKLRIVATQRNLEHGVPLTEGDITFQCERIVEDRSIEKLTGVQKYLAEKFGVTEGYMSQIVGALVNRRKASRDSIILRLKLLGWSSPEISKVTGVKDPTVRGIVKNFNTKEINDLYKQQEKTIEELATFYHLDQTLTWAIVLQGKSDQERGELLDFEPKVYDVWNYSECNKLMGQEYQGQIPGQIALNVLYYHTKQGDLVVDLMAGGGTTNDACLLMGRKCYSYDINPPENRRDIMQHDYLNGPPGRVKKADLIFLDPPYFKKKEVEYGSESISALNREDYLKAIDKLAEVCEGHRVALVMGKYYDYGNPRDGIFLAEYVNIFEKHGFRQIDELSINLPPPEGGQHAVVSAKKENRMEILKRDLIVFG